MTSPSRPSGLAEPLRKLLRRVEAGYPDRAHRIWEVWETAVGPDIAKRSCPTSFQGGRLLVSVSTAPWLQQLSFLRETIRDAVNGALGAPLVTEVRLRLGAVAPPPAPRSAPAPPSWLAEPLPQEVLRRIERELEPVADPQLRETLRQVRVRAEQVRRFREDRASAPPPESSGGLSRGE
ncbi:MAG: DUF721 domain-containing protein [Deferrisomatales bacterium]